MEFEEFEPQEDDEENDRVHMYILRLNRNTEHWPRKTSMV